MQEATGTCLASAGCSLVGTIKCKVLRSTIFMQASCSSDACCIWAQHRGMGGGTNPSKGLRATFLLLQAVQNKVQELVQHFLNQIIQPETGLAVDKLLGACCAIQIIQVRFFYKTVTGITNAISACGCDHHLNRTLLSYSLLEPCAGTLFQQHGRSAGPCMRQRLRS